MHHAGAGHRNAGAGTAGEIAVGLRRIGRALLVAHAEIGNAFLLRRRRYRGDRKPDDPEQVIDALLLQAAREKRSAIDFAHGFPPYGRLNLSREIMHPSPGGERAMASDVRYSLPERPRRDGREGTAGGPRPGIHVEAPEMRFL